MLDVMSADASLPAWSSARAGILLVPRQPDLCREKYARPST